ncbi:MAG: hypothetical protein ACXVCY_08070 [Pseudobdellovibrionaceae bacterium]
MIHFNRLFLSCLLCLTPLISFKSFAVGGDMVNNGGGIAEKNILIAYDRLGKYIQLCLNSDLCKLNGSQKNILRDILTHLSQEKQNQQQIQFASEVKKPGTFIIDGLIRVAKTGSSIGSMIYINSDLLYSKNEVNSYDPVSIPEAAAILIHELGHHYGQFTHEELDLIGIRVSLMLQHSFISTPLVPWTSDVSLNVFNQNLTSSFPDVLLSVGDDVVDISDLYAKEALCYAITIPIPILPLPDIQLLSKKPVGSLFHNVHWDKFKEDSSGNVLKMKVLGNVSNNCLYKVDIGALRVNDYKMSIEFTAYKVNANWIVDKQSIKLNQFQEPWYKIIKLPVNPF